ncbi:MAG: alpha/beta hydrolase fold domain-containing protein [Gemmataceae bacterium]
MNRLFILPVLSLFVATSSGVIAQETREVDYKADVVYGKGGKQKLMLDLAVPNGPKAKGPFPTIVCIHGGGWRTGSRKQLSELTKVLGKKGFVAATISYRLTPKAKFPAQVHDCKAAVRWLRANAKKYRIDPNKIGAVGFSAGAHLVCLLGAADKTAGLEGNGGHPKQSSRVQAVVSFFGPTDFMVKRWTKQSENFFLIPFFGAPYKKAKALYAKGSPQKYVSKDDPPFLFFHGDKDTLVGLHNSVDMAKLLRAKQVSAEVVVMKGEGHGWGGKKLQQSLEKTVKFFKEKLR